jgi:hypothetical protein
MVGEPGAKAGIAPEVSDEPERCWLCGRLLGRRVQLHHPVPKSKGGRETVPLHPICHRTIHAHFSNAELARLGDSREALLAREPVARFVAWVVNKPADLHAPTRSGR